MRDGDLDKLARIAEDRWVDFERLEKLQAQELAADATGSTKRFRVFSEADRGGWFSEVVDDGRGRRRSEDTTKNNFGGPQAAVFANGGIITHQQEDINHTTSTGTTGTTTLRATRKRKRGWEKEHVTEGAGTSPSVGKRARDEDDGGARNERRGSTRRRRGSGSGDSLNEDNIDGEAIEVDDVLDGALIEDVDDLGAVDGEEDVDGEEVDSREWESLMDAIGVR